MSLVFLDFPYPTRKNLVDQMTKTDLIRVSLQSERARNALKECGKEVSFFDLTDEEKKQLNQWDQMELFLLQVNRSGTLSDWHLDLIVVVCDKFEIHLTDRYFDSSIRIESLNCIDNYIEKRRSLKIGENVVPAVVIEDKKLKVEKILVFFNDRTEGLISILNYFEENFNLPIDHLEINGDNSTDFSKNMRKIVLCCSQQSVQTALIGDKKALIEADYEFVLTNLAVTERFNAYSKTSDNFVFNGKIQAECITVWNGHWFKIAHLFGSDYEEIKVSGSEITKEELQFFLREWTNGKFLKLFDLRLGTNMENVFDALEGFERYPRGRHAFSPFLYGDTCRTIKGPGLYYATVYGHHSPEFHMQIQRNV